MALFIIATFCFFYSITGYHTLGESVTYEELESMNVTCDPLDNCRTNRTSDTLSLYNCMCESSCSNIGTCCLDSAFSNDQHPASCQDVGNGNSFFMVDSCRPDWIDADYLEPYVSERNVVKLCQDIVKDPSDLLLMIPVTDSEGGITYKNYFCAVCNDVQNELTPWNVQLESTVEVETIEGDLPKIFYNHSIQSLMIRNSNNVKIPVTMSAKVPSILTKFVHKCYSNEISNCADDWTDNVLAKKCGAYMATVFFMKENGDVLKYRNSHCAICNHEKVSDRSCTDPKILYRIATEKTFFVGLFVLKDKMHDNKTTKSPIIISCPKKMVYDKLAKKCRRISCRNKNEVVQGTKCVPRTA